MSISFPFYRSHLQRIIAAAAAAMFCWNAYVFVCLFVCLSLSLSACVFVVQINLYTKESMHGAHIYCIFIACSHTCARGSRFTSNLIESAAWLGSYSCIVVRSLALCCVYVCLARAHTQHNTTQHNTAHSMNIFFLHTLLRLNHTDCKQLTFNSGNERTRISVSVYYFVCIHFFCGSCVTNFVFFWATTAHRSQINGPSAQSSVCVWRQLKFFKFSAV